MKNLLENDEKKPLADILRPKSLANIVGQEHLTAEDAPLGLMMQTGHFSSFILWGPAGCGKTSIARLLAGENEMHFEPLSAIFSGVADLRKVFKEAQDKKKDGIQTLLFVDEIHRFNKAQQDSFLPYIEDGTIILVGATTENPSFELNAALLSRCQVLVLRRLGADSLKKLIDRAEEFKGRKIPLDEAAKEAVLSMADGDGRTLLNMVETIFDFTSQDTTKLLDQKDVTKFLNKRSPVFDKSGDGHYNLMSALHKSLRSSDTNASLYWVARMIDAGEDPRYILRRLTRFAAEDVGLADPEAINQAIVAWNAYERLGSPEGDLAISMLVIYLATSPKSNSAYAAHNEARETAKKTGSLMPPMHILNAPTALMKDLGYNKGYVYDHDTPNGFSGQNCFPDDMTRKNFYKPIERGFEREVAKRYNWFEKQRENK
ncbi:MAG: replication-associated recombination protein A [Alphaproteobacteria bacterium]